MFKILFACILVALYYFSNITYTPNTSKNVAYAKVSSEWKGIEIDTEKMKLKDNFYFNFFVSFGLNDEVSKKIEFSYISKHQ